VKDWPKVKLADVAERCLGKMLDARKNKGRLMPYLRNPNVRWFDVDTSELQSMPFEDREQERYGLKAGDIVICEGGEAGRAAIWDGRLPDLKFQKAIHRVRPGPRLHNRYFVHQLMADHQAGRLGDYLTGATIKHFTGQDLARYMFPLPPLAEQRRIAEVLDRAEALRDKRRAALAQLDSLTQSLFLDLFGDPKSNLKAWPQKAMAELFATSPIFGTMIPPVAEKRGWLSLRVGNIQDWSLDLSDQKYVELPSASRERHSVKDGDLLLARAIASQDHLGKCVIAHPNGEQWAFDSHLMRLRFDLKHTEPEFIRHLFMTPGGRSIFLRASRKSTVQFNINTKEMSALQIPVPPIELQREFARRVTAVEKLKTAQRASLAELDALFATLQHRAFRGDLRV
jgi:type I restriction enzyme S subunit